MSRSTFLTTKEADLRYHHALIATSNRPNETPSKTTNTSISRHHPKAKRNLRDKRRATGIRPNDVPRASTSTEGSANEDAEDDEKVEDQTDSYALNLTLIPSGPTKPVFTVNRIQSTFENLSISRSSTNASSTTTTTKIHRPDDYHLQRVDKQTPDDDLAVLKGRIHALETIIHEKDSHIHELQQKLTNTTQNLTDAEGQIYKLHQDKLTLIKALTTIQENKSPPVRSNLISRNS